MLWKIRLLFSLIFSTTITNTYLRAWKIGKSEFFEILFFLHFQKSHQFRNERLQKFKKKTVGNKGVWIIGVRPKMSFFCNLALSILTIDLDNQYWLPGYCLKIKILRFLRPYNIGFAFTTCDIHWLCHVNILPILAWHLGSWQLMLWSIVRVCLFSNIEFAITNRSGCANTLPILAQHWLPTKKPLPKKFHCGANIDVLLVDPTSKTHK